MRHEPNKDDIDTFFERLFSHVTIDGCIEIAFTLPDTGAINNARMFKVEDYADAADFAYQTSRKEGQNVYFGVGIRKVDTPQARANDDDVFALTLLCADFDDEGGLDAAIKQAKELGIAPPIGVITGREPHKRGHIYYPLEDPIKDTSIMRQALAATAQIFNGDPSIKNPSRIMRVPGTVAWPKKKGRTTEVTELHTPTGRKQTFYIGEITRHLPKPTPDEQKHDNIVQYPKGTLAISPLDERTADDISHMLNGDHWHDTMVRTVGRRVAQGWTDEQIQAELAQTTLPGYTAQETHDEVQVAIDGARKKDFAPKAVQARQLMVTEQQTQPADQEQWDVGNDDNNLHVTWFEDVISSTDTQDFVEDTLGIGQMSVIYGESNSGKTFFACDMALHTSMGWDWRGKETDQTGVIYCALEGTHGITNRLAAFKDHYKDEIQGEIPPFGIITTAINLLDPDADTRRLIDTIIAAKDRSPTPIGLVVIDTLSRAMSGGNENSPDDMGALVINSDRIRQATGAHVMWIHHSGKDQARGARGHSLLRAATDTEIEVQRSENGPSVATIRKQREFEGGQEYPFGLKQITLGLNKRGKEVTSCVVTHDAEMPIRKKAGKKNEPSTANQKIAYSELNILMKNAEVSQRIRPKHDMAVLTCVKEDTLKSAFYGQLSNGRKDKAKAWESALEGLIANGWIRKHGDWVWLIKEETNPENPENPEKRGD